MSIGFTDRSFADRHPNAPRDPARDERLTIVVNLHRDERRSILVSTTADGDVAQAWLAKSLIAIEPVSFGRTLRIQLPRWLAEEKGLIAGAGDGQGRLL